jgi:hypothetical protein
MHSRVGSVMVLIFGIAVGLGCLALGAYLGTGNNGWRTAIFFSVVGLVGASLTGFAWTSRRSKRRTMVAGIALVSGILASMGLLLELTSEQSEIAFASTQVPWLVAAWFVIWAGWIAAALGRLILFTPPRTRARLSSRRGDGGS